MWSCSFYRPQTKFVKVMFLQASVCPRGGMLGRGTCMARGMNGRGACMARGHAWQGACVVGGVWHANPLADTTRYSQ